MTIGAGISRRRALGFGMGAGAFAVGGQVLTRAYAQAPTVPPRPIAEPLSATEDLMREHGVISRILVFYREAARRLRHLPSEVPPSAIADAGRLFRDFAGRYHERTMEEGYVFPALREAGPTAMRLVAVLITQHERGQAINDYIMAQTSGGVVQEDRAEGLALAMESLSRMQEAHTAQEDTVVFPAWRNMMSAAQLNELADRFAEIERRQLGADGHDDAVQRILRAEQALGITDLDAFSAPKPGGGR